MTVLENTTTAIASARRAAAAQRLSGTILDVEFSALTALDAITDQWRELAVHALEPNVFYEPEFALAAAPLLGADISVGLVWSTDTPRQLLGFFPARIERRRYGIPIPVLTGWTHPYGPLGTPLVHRDFAEPVVSAWLEHVARDSKLPDLLLMRFLPDEGPFAAIFRSVLAQHQCERKSFGCHQRAALLDGDNRGIDFERNLSAKRRSDLRRQRHRLERLGHVALEEVSAAAIAAGLDEFVTLEAAGWKGRAGTAAMQNENVLRFMRRVVLALARERQASIHRLLLNSRTIAATITLKSGNSAWCWKIGYDEGYAAYSPGVLLVAEITKALLADTTIMRVDSCATASQMMINRLWPQRIAIADYLAAARPEAELSLVLAARLEALRRTAIGAAKSLRDSLRSG